MPFRMQQQGRSYDSNNASFHCDPFFFIPLYACKYAYACMWVCVMCTKSAPNSFFILTLTQPTTAVFSYKFYNTFAFQMICHHILLTLTHIRMFSGYISVDRHIYVVFFLFKQFLAVERVIWRVKWNAVHARMYTHASRTHKCNRNLFWTKTRLFCAVL